MNSLYPALAIKEGNSFITKNYWARTSSQANSNVITEVYVITLRSFTHEDGQPSTLLAVIYYT